MFLFVFEARTISKKYTLQCFVNIVAEFSQIQDFGQITLSHNFVIRSARIIKYPQPGSCQENKSGDSVTESLLSFVTCSTSSLDLSNSSTKYCSGLSGLLYTI